MPSVRPRRALVLSQGRSRGALAAVRALGQAGWWVEVGTPEGGGIVGASRWARATHRVARPRGDHSEFLADVGDAVRRGQHDVVFGGADDWMAALAHHRRCVPTRVAHPSSEVVARALDKVEVTRLAAAHGITAPRTVTEADAVDWSGGVVVKARRHWFEGIDRTVRLEAWLAPDAAAAGQRAHALGAAGIDVIHQQPVDGQLTAIIGVFDGVRLHGTVQQVADGTWPWPHGVSSYARTVAPDPALVRPLERFLVELGWHGLVEVQYLRDAAGAAHLIDVNGRFYGSMALALAAGPNLVDAWARLVVDGALPDLPEGRPGIEYVRVAGDLRRALAERRGGLVRDVAGCLRRVVRANARSVVTRADPGPAGHLALGWLGLAPRPGVAAAASPTRPRVRA